MCVCRPGLILGIFLDQSSFYIVKYILNPELASATLTSQLAAEVPCLWSTVIAARPSPSPSFDVDSGDPNSGRRILGGCPLV